MSYPAYPEYKDSGAEWLGAVPSHWAVKRLKYCLTPVREKTTFLDRPIALEHLESWSGALVEAEVDYEGDGIAFEPADILFGKLRPYLAKVFRARTPGQAVGDFHVMRPTSEIDPDYAEKQILQEGFISVADGATYGAKMPRVGWEFMANMLFSVPPKYEQTQIARFLDHQTARIDALIAEQQRLIELLKEKRQAVISHAVTKGLDPDVAMKDSGVEWLGEVPKHWHVVQFRRLMVGQTLNGLYKSEQEQDPNGALFIQMGETFRDRVYRGGSAQRVKCKTEELNKWGLKEGDLLFARRSIVLEGSGRCTRIGPIDEPHLFESSMIRVRPDNRMAVPEFVHFLFDSTPMRAQMLATTKTVTISGIDSSQLKSLKLVLPPMQEQKKIVKYIDDWQSSLSYLEEHANNSITLLKERRSALISAAVTGKIDVRDWEPPVSETFRQSNASEEAPA